MTSGNVITLNSRDYPPKAFTVFHDRAEARREFPGIKLTVFLSLLNCLISIERFESSCH